MKKYTHYNEISKLLLVLAIILTFISSNSLVHSSTIDLSGGRATLKCIDWDDASDTTIVVLDSLQFYYPENGSITLNCTVFPDYFMQIFLRTVNGCTGVGTWDISTESSMLRWSNGTTCSAEGTITIDKLDTINNNVSGSFDFEMAAYTKKQFWQIIAEFEFGSAGLSMDISQGNSFDLSKGDTLDIDLNITDPEGNPADSSIVYVKNPFAEIDEFLEIGMVNPSGEISYSLIVPADIEDGEYIYEFYAMKDGFSDSPIIECSVNISKQLSISADPGPNILMDFRDTTEFLVTITNDMNETVEGAGIIIEDLLQTDGTPFNAGVTDADGMYSYMVITNEETLKGDYSIKFFAFQEEYPDTVSTEVNITVSSKLAINVMPDTTAELTAKDTIMYNISVKNSYNEPAEGAIVMLVDSLSSDGTAQNIGVANAEGVITYQLIVPEKAVDGLFKLKFWAELENFDNSDTLERVINVKIKSDCVDIGLLTICTNASKGWESADSTNPNNNKIKQEGIVSVNGFLFFTGSMVLDTAELSMTATGSFYVDDIPLPGGGMGKYVINKGSYQLKLLGGDGIITDFYNSSFEELGEIFGVKFKITSLELVGGRRAEGMKMSCKLSIPGIAGGCGEPDETSTEIDFNGLSVTDSLGFTVDGVSIKNLGLYYPNFCLKEFSYAYDRKLDKLALGTEIGMPFGSVGGGFALVKGLIDSIGWKIDGGWPPKFILGTSTVGISGFFGHMSNITSPDLELALGGIFIDLTSEYLYSIDVTGKYKMPSFFELAGEGSFFKPPVGVKHWQLKGDISASYDFSNWLMELKGAVKIATQDGVKYLISGTGSFKMDNKLPQPKFAGKFTGDIELPKFKEKYPYKWLNSMFDFPIKGACWTRFIYAKSKVMYGEATFSSGSYGPYKLDFVIDLAKSWGDDDYFWFKAESGAGNVIVRGHDGDPSNGIALINASKVDAILEGEVTETFDIPENTDLIVINLRSETQVPISSLEDPDANIYTETSADHSVALTFSEDNKECFWTLMNPQAGAWVITIQDPADTDTLDVFMQETPVDFEIQAVQDGSKVTVTWDNEGMSDVDTVYILLDDNDSGFDGFSVASVDASMGEATFMLNDTMDACSYNIFALYEGEDYLSAYAEDEIINPKATLFPPDNIIVEYDTITKIVYISWSPSDEESLIGYSIRLVDDYGLDSLIADVFNSVSEISFEMADIEGKQVQFIAYNEAGHSGCPSVPIDIELVVVDVEENILSENSKLSVYPNPARDMIKIKYNITQPGDVILKISDILGNDILTIDEGYKDNGSHIKTYSLSEFGSGMYYCKFSVGGYTETVKMVVVK
ncbi:T9SS type A sorting domain-containing protein [Bacteroidota bacterium]